MAMASKFQCVVRVSCILKCSVRLFQVSVGRYVRLRLAVFSILVLFESCCILTCRNNISFQDKSV
jgi:hypothetical protein